MPDSIDANAVERVTVAWNLDRAKNKGELWTYIKREKSPKKFKDFIYETLKAKLPTSSEFNFIKTKLGGNKQILKTDKIITFKWKGKEAVSLRDVKGRFKAWGLLLPPSDKKG